MAGKLSGGCETHFIALKTVLDRKYGVSVVSESSGTTTAKWGREMDGNTITLICSWTDWMSLTYTDHVIEATSTDELIYEAEEKAGNL